MKNISDTKNEAIDKLTGNWTPFIFPFLISAVAGLLLMIPYVLLEIVEVKLLLAQGNGADPQAAMNTMLEVFTSHLPLFLTAFVLFFFIMIAVIVFYNPLAVYSCSKMANDLVKGKKLLKSEFFRNFKYFSRAMGNYWYLIFRLWLWYILLWVCYAAPVFIYMRTGIPVLILISMTLLIIGVVFFIRKAFEYSYNFFIAADTKAYDAFQSLKISSMITKGYIGETFLLNFSFIGWKILSGITLGFSQLFSGPYYLVTQAVRFQDLKADFIRRTKVMDNEKENSPEENAEKTEDEK